MIQAAASGQNATRRSRTSGPRSRGPKEAAGPTRRSRRPCASSPRQGPRSFRAPTPSRARRPSPSARSEMAPSPTSSRRARSIRTASETTGRPWRRERNPTQPPWPMVTTPARIAGRHTSPRKAPVRPRTACTPSDRSRRRSSRSRPPLDWASAPRTARPSCRDPRDPARAMGSRGLCTTPPQSTRQ